MSSDHWMNQQFTWNELRSLAKGRGLQYRNKFELVRSLRTKYSEAQLKQKFGFTTKKPKTTEFQVRLRPSFIFWRSNGRAREYVSVAKAIIEIPGLTQVLLSDKTKNIIKDALGELDVIDIMYDSQETGLLTVNGTFRENPNNYSEDEKGKKHVIDADDILEELEEFDDLKADTWMEGDIVVYENKKKNLKVEFDLTLVSVKKIIS